MITPFDIYLIGSIDGIKVLFVCLLIVSCAFAVICFFGIDDENDTEYAKRLWKYIIYSLIVSVISLLTAVLLPSSKTLAAMYIIPPVVKAAQENKQINQIPQAALDLIKSYTKKEETNDDNN